MFVVKQRNYPLVNSKYELSELNELNNNTFDGGGRLYINQEERHLYIDMNGETCECYGIVAYLDAIKFKIINYSIKHSKDVSLFYLPKKKVCPADYSEDNLLKSDFFIDRENQLILIGDVNVSGECYQFFKDTYCIMNNGSIELLIIKVGKEILQHIMVQ